MRIMSKRESKLLCNKIPKRIAELPPGIKTTNIVERNRKGIGFSSVQLSFFVLSIISGCLNGVDYTKQHFIFYYYFLFLQLHLLIALEKFHRQMVFILFFVLYSLSFTISSIVHVNVTFLHYFFFFVLLVLLFTFLLNAGFYLIAFKLIRFLFLFFFLFCPFEKRMKNLLHTQMHIAVKMKNI